ncbi:hypothetical protein CDO27_34180 (plasmid) [Sinorhizobium meliloti]|nr:hypothetical protein CDO27_34180 [Sinorhizobium meliloti]CCM72077.1 hypothetical protein BN406_05795 [Sinorhizobium meliloti Rm41]
MIGRVGRPCHRPCEKRPLTLTLSPHAGRGDFRGLGGTAFPFSPSKRVKRGEGRGSGMRGEATRKCLPLPHTLNAAPISVFV